MTVEEGAAGLGGLASASGLTDDPIIRLRVALEEWAAPLEDALTTRDSLRDLAKLLIVVLGPELNTLSPMEDGTTLEIEHRAISELAALVDALNDLEIGVVTPFLKHSSVGGTARLPTQQDKHDAAVLLGIEAICTVESGTPGALLSEGQTPEAYAAKQLDQAGQMRRGKRYSESVLKNLQRNMPERKPKPD